jgi:hypothetical protein
MSILDFERNIYTYAIKALSLSQFIFLSKIMQFILSALILICLSTATNSCKPGWHHFQDKWYYLNETPNSFQANQDLCASLNGTMVSIHSDRENAFVFSLVGVGNIAWLGFSRTNTGSATFAWMDNTCVDYHNMPEHNQDYNYAGACYGIYLNGMNGGRWGSQLCYDINKYMQLCQISQNRPFCRREFDLKNLP